MDALPPLLTVPERRNPVAREQIVSRVRAEFTEMPCLRLTAGQAQRLFGLRADVCQRVLGALVREHLLVCASDGRYMARHDSAGARPAAAGNRPEGLRSRAS